MWITEGHNEVHNSDKERERAELPQHPAHLMMNPSLLQELLAQSLSCLFLFLFIFIRSDSRFSVLIVMICLEPEVEPKLFLILLMLVILTTLHLYAGK